MRSVAMWGMETINQYCRIFIYLYKKRKHWPLLHYNNQHEESFDPECCGNSPMLMATCRSFMQIPISLCVVNPVKYIHTVMTKFHAVTQLFESLAFD